jgi:hypothetical protein
MQFEHSKKGPNNMYNPNFAGAKQQPAAAASASQQQPQEESKQSSKKDKKAPKEEESNMTNDNNESNDVQPEKPTSIGEDTEWFADVAAAAQELMLAGTLREALHQRILMLITQLITVFMAHLDRNGGFTLLATTAKRDLWLLIAPSTLTSPLSVRLLEMQELAVRDVGGEAASRRKNLGEVATDAQTPEKTFQSRFPFSWFVSKTIENLQSSIRPLPAADRLAALETQFKLTQLSQVGFEPKVSAKFLDDYLSDFTAMHVDWMPVEREKQHEIMRAVLKRAKGSELESILEIHVLFWAYEDQVRFCIGLVDAVPQALGQVDKIIQTAPMIELNPQLLLAVHRLLINELLGLSEAVEGGSRGALRGWLHRKMMVAGLTEDFFFRASQPCGSGQRRGYFLGYATLGSSFGHGASHRDACSLYKTCGISP